MWFSKANHRTKSVTPDTKPWEFTPAKPIPDLYRSDKDARRSWMEDAKTLHEEHSLVEGLIPTQAVDAENPPIKLHGLVADFDALIGPEELQKALGRCGDMLPQWYSRSLSGNARFYWVFQEPILVNGQDDAKAFLAHLGKLMGLNKILPGLDTASYNPAQYYTNSCQWQVISEKPSIPQELLVGWRIESARNTKTKEKADIPMPELKAELERRFPKFSETWKHQAFDLGSFGVRFWDSAADNIRGCMIRPTGMQCFTGSRPFVPWEDLVGNEFIQRYTASRIGKAVEDLWYDGQYIWRKIPHERRGFTWQPYAVDPIKIYLAVKKGLEPDEIKEALEYVYSEKVIYGALPFFHKPRGSVFWMHDKRYLNTALCEPIKPGEETGIRWCEADLGWIYKFVDGFFSDKYQLRLYLSWLSRFYKAMHTGTPSQNLIMFIAGPVHRGKNLLSAIVAELVGDSADASHYFLQQDNFNGELFGYPFWRIDDATALATEDSHRKYSSLIKKIAANREFRVRELYRTAKMLEWMGIVVITLNVDAESVRMLPDIDSSLLDKVTFLRTSDKPTCEFLPANEQMAEIKKWLPNFARFLLEWETPEDCKGTARHGVRSWQEETLLQAAKQSSPTNGFLEILRLFLNQYFAAQKDKTKENYHQWTGNATELLHQMNQDQALASTARNLSMYSVGRQLSKLKQQGFDLDMRQLSTQRQWVIRRDAKFLQVEQPRNAYVPSPEDDGYDPEPQKPKAWNEEMFPANQPY